MSMDSCIRQAKKEEFRKAVHRIFRTADKPSAVRFNAMKEKARNQALEDKIKGSVRVPEPTFIKSVPDSLIACMGVI